MLTRRVFIVFLLASGLPLLARAQGLVSARILSSEGQVEIRRRGQGQAELT